MKVNIENSKKGKILIQDYVDMYLEGAKFFKFFGSALTMTALDSQDRAAQILRNAKSVKEAYGLKDDDPAVIYINDFMEFEMSKKLANFNLDDNAYLLTQRAKEDIHPFMETYISTTFHFERGAWTFEYMHDMFKLMVEHRKMSNYDVGVKAYSDTMAKYHNWILRNTVKFILLGITDRDAYEKAYMKEQAAVRNNGLPYTLQQMYSDLKEFYLHGDQISKYIWSFLNSHGIEHLP